MPDFAGEKGQLVEQILEQIQEEGVVGRRVEIDWDQDGNYPLNVAELFIETVQQVCEVRTPPHGKSPN